MKSKIKFDYDKKNFKFAFIISLFGTIFLIFYAIFSIFDYIRLLLFIVAEITLVYMVLVTGASYFNYHIITDKSVIINCLGSNNEIKLSEIKSIQKISNEERKKISMEEYLKLSKSKKEYCQIDLKLNKDFKIALFFFQKRKGIIFDVNNIDKYIQLISDKIS